MNATGRALYVFALMSALIWLIRGTDAFMWLGFLALIGGWFLDAAGDSDKGRAMPNGQDSVPATGKAS